MPDLSRDFLRSEHPIHKAWDPIWKLIERGMKGGAHMRETLRRYQWENGIKGEAAFKARRDQATYINLPEMYLSSMVGQIARKFPRPGQGLDFGTLGTVDADLTRITTRAPTPAELLYYNCDGVGNDGSQWDKWWTQSAKQAAGFGHIWIMEESAPSSGDPARVRTRIDEIRGARPYLVRFSPSRVWDWEFDNGELQFAIVRTSYRRARKGENGMMSPQSGDQYLLVTRRGFDALGSEYAGGGFWLYDADLRPVVRNAAPVEGNWDSLDGAIPLHIMYGERDDGSEELPAISRPAVSELLSLAISYMNLSSAADFEVWDSAKGLEYALGVDRDMFNLAVEIMEDGSRLVPIGVKSSQTLMPQIHASNMATTPEGVFKSRLADKRTEAELHGMFTPSSTPDSSGLSKALGFSENKAPRLALLASEIESAMNTAIPNLERRWAGTSNRTATGVAKIPRKFDLLEQADALSRVLDEVMKVEVKSATLFAHAVTTIARESGAITDETILKAIGDEIAESVENDAELASRMTEIAAADKDADDDAPPAADDDAPPAADPPAE